MFNVRLTDEQLLEYLRGNDAKLRNRAFNHLYRQYFGMATAFIRQNKGQESDARDVFQDALIVLYDNVRSCRFKETSSIGTYLYAIVRNIWLIKLRKRKLLNELTDQYEPGENPEIEEAYFHQNGELRPLLDKAFEEIPIVCRDMLRLFYYEKRSMTEIMTILEYKNEDSAKSQRYKCLNKLIEVIEKNQLLKNKLREVL
jgi:RNA polymerase sigma factor (sigma-70 family)